MPTVTFAIGQMQDAFQQSPSPFSQSRSGLAWLIVPAVVMSLAWGLRGYIGGGPFGAMIPGALVPLMLCQFLGYKARASAVVVAFGTLGIGFGGSMTYGQTLGLIRVPETFWWGLTGTTLKGAVWGLLGGAVLGLGFAARHVAWRHLVLGLVCMLIGIVLGIHFVDQPKLIYFSDPVTKPRDESWAGFLCGALALLAYLRLFEPRFAPIPLRFALYAAIGGGIGFGGGSLLMAVQANVSEPWRWLPYWKFMEYTFGFLFGAALGLCALHSRDRLTPLMTPTTEGTTDETQTSALQWSLGLLAASAVVLGVLYGRRWFIAWIIPELRELPPDDLRRTTASVLLGFSGTGCLLMLLARRWQTVAWQTAISVTIVAAAIDWQRDLLPRGHIDLPALYRSLFVLGVAAICIVTVHRWQHRPAPKLMNLFLFAVCFLMAIGYMMGLARTEIWQPDSQAAAAAGGHAAFLWQHFGAEIIVHIIFTTLFLVSVWAAARERRPSG